MILEVDHIKPVSKGGTNEIINLVTSCRDCNRGKSDKTLSDNTAITVQKKRLDEMQERREQLEMMVEWRESLEDVIDVGVTSIDKLYERYTGWCLGEYGKQQIRKLIKRFGFDEVYTAVWISINSYYTGTEGSWDFAFKKVGGICYNRKKASVENA